MMRIMRIFTHVCANICRNADMSINSHLCTSEKWGLPISSVDAVCMLQQSHVDKKDMETAGTKNVVAAQEACCLNHVKVLLGK